MENKKTQTELHTSTDIIVMKPAVAETLRNFKPGAAHYFSCSEFVPYASASCAVTRLNQAAGREVYKISSPDNGATYTIQRIA